MNRYAHIVRAVFDRPWAIHPAKLEAIKAFIALKASGGSVSAEEVREIVAAAGPRRQAQSDGAVAVLPLQGVIMYRAGLMAETSGAVSLESWMRALRAAVADPDIASIILDIDSPGGSVEGLTEAAAEIRAAREQKPITAIANTTAASAAYWLATQATELVVTPSGWVGSVGVYSAHEDWSAYWESEGVKTTLISAGKFKVEANEYEPLSDEAKAHMQAMVDDYYGMFVADVAKGRNVPASAVRSGFGEGRMLLAKEAKAEGMVDRIDTYDGVIRRAMPVRRKAVALGQGWDTLAADPEQIEAEMPSPPTPDPDPVPPRADLLEIARIRQRSHSR